MLVLIDIGNTRLKWATANATRLKARGALTTASVIAGADVPHELKLASREQDVQVWISCVASSEVIKALKSGWFSLLDADQINIVSVTDYAANVSNCYADINRLGVDRWIAAIGARGLIDQGDLIVIDAGTAVTVDWVDHQNRFQGGAILPGPALMHDALVGRTAGIESEFQKPSTIVGKTTSECVNSGVAYGLVGAVQRVVTEMQNTINRPAQLCLTGGAADFLGSEMSIETHHYPELVLQGLHRLAVFAADARQA